MGRHIAQRLTALILRLKQARSLQLVKQGLTVVRDVVFIILAIIAIFIAYRDYLRTDIEVAISAPRSGYVIMNREVTIEGVVSGGPYDGYTVLHKAPGDAQGRVVSTAQGNSADAAIPVFPISLPLADENGTLKIGQHTVTVMLKAGSRTVAQDFVTFDVIDCSLIVPRELCSNTPVHDVVDLRPIHEIQGYDFLYYIDGVEWTLDSLNPEQLEDGYHQLRIVAVLPGSEEEVDSVVTSYIVDNSAPTIQSLGVSDGATISGRSEILPQVHDPHLSSLKLCIDSELVDELSGSALEERREEEDLAFTLMSGWSKTDAVLAAHSAALQSTEPLGSVDDGWHEVMLRACDVNGLCTSESANVLVDSTRPDMRWDLAGDISIRILPTGKIWLGGKSAESDVAIWYYVDEPAFIEEGQYLNTSACENGSVHDVMATAIDLAGNAEIAVASFAVEQTTRAWANTMARSILQGFTVAATPISHVIDGLASEGMALGFGAELSSSLADENVVMWRGIIDFSVLQICPIFGQGFGGNDSIGVAFQVPIGAKFLTSSALIEPFIHPSFEFGAALTPNWQVLDSLDYGVETVAETWVKLSLSTAVAIPLVAQANVALNLCWAPGVKLTFVQEYWRQPAGGTNGAGGVERLVETTPKLEITIDASISFSARRSR